MCWLKYFLVCVLRVWEEKVVAAASWCSYSWSWRSLPLQLYRMVVLREAASEFMVHGCREPSWKCFDVFSHALTVAAAVASSIYTIKTTVSLYFYSTTTILLSHEVRQHFLAFLQNTPHGNRFEICLLVWMRQAVWVPRWKGKQT